MPPTSDPELMAKLQRELEAFIQSLAHPMVLEEEVDIFDLTSARWKLSVEFGKLLFEAWNESRSISRRVESVAYRDGKSLGVFVRRPGGRERITLEFRDLFQPERSIRTRAANRTRFRKEFIGLLEQEYRGWRLERVSNRSDLEHSFSGW